MKSVYRIIDANINRAMEGLRVVEEVVRFDLDMKDLTLKVKQLRARIKSAALKIPRQKLLSARASISDVGSALYTRSEATRLAVEDIFYSNIKRCEESMRVLEEFSKVIGRNFGGRFKSIRFELYEIEKQAGKQLVIPPGLYIITDPSRDPVKTVKAAAEAGVKIVQFRDKYSGIAELLATAKRLRAITKRYGMKLIINDRADIAAGVDADGVHVGQGDMAYNKARKMLGPEKIIGVSAGSILEAVNAEKEGADYIGFGPVFKTIIKPDLKPLGLSLLSRAVKIVNIPVVALGGINASNIDQVLKYTRHIAVISAVAGEKDMKKAALRLLERFEEQ